MEEGKERGRGQEERESEGREGVHNLSKTTSVIGWLVTGVDRRGVSSCSSLGWPEGWPHLNLGAKNSGWRNAWLSELYNLTPSYAMPRCECSYNVTLLPCNQGEGQGPGQVLPLGQCPPTPDHPLEPPLLDGQFGHYVCRHKWEAPDLISTWPLCCCCAYFTGQPIGWQDTIFAYVCLSVCMFLALFVSVCCFFVFSKTRRRVWMELASLLRHYSKLGPVPRKTAKKMCCNWVAPATLY